LKVNLPDTLTQLQLPCPFLLFVKSAQHKICFK